MALICNKVSARSDASETAISDNEVFIERGSAYFSQAYAEALGILSDLELRKVPDASLRLSAIHALLSNALSQYAEAIAVGDQKDINSKHQKKLTDAGLDSQGARTVLNVALERGFLSAGSDRLDAIAGDLDRLGYVGIMNDYINRVRDLKDFVGEAKDWSLDDTAAVAWQELGWSLTSKFADALELGKGIAILNTLSFRIDQLAGTASSPAKTVN